MQHVGLPIQEIVRLKEMARAGGAYCIYVV
jgi:hypothetical protein